MLTEGDLNKFLKNSPKYAGMAGRLIGATMMMLIVAVPVIGGITATYLAVVKNKGGW